MSLFAVATITSCSNDDDNDSSSASIEGKWEISKEGETLETLEAVENVGNCGLTIVEILKGGAIITTYFDFYDSVCETDTEPGTWSKKDKILIIKGNDGEDYTYTEEHEIIELTNATLTLKEKDEDGTWYSVYNRK